MKVFWAWETQFPKVKQQEAIAEKRENATKKSTLPKRQSSTSDLIHKPYLNTLGCFILFRFLKKFKITNHARSLFNAPGIGIIFFYCGWNCSGLDSNSATATLFSAYWKYYLQPKARRIRSFLVRRRRSWLPHMPLSQFWPAASAFRSGCYLAVDLNFWVPSQCSETLA